MTFLEKFEILKKSVPVPSVVAPDSIDCEYVDGAYGCKNCYFCYGLAGAVDCIYSNRIYGTNIVDSVFVLESEKCYQCADCNKCHNCTYLINSNNSTDCHFSTFLISCSDCFGCVALTHKKYCIFNKQYGKEEYIKRVNALKKEKPEKILAEMIKLKQKIPHPASQQYNNENCPYGDYIYNSKNCYLSFSTYYSENSGFTLRSIMLKNCWDVYFSGGFVHKKTFSQRCYELVDVRNCYDCAFLISSQECINCCYSSHLINCTDCFGCMGLTNKKYCILNNQLTKDQYEKAVKEIKSELGWKF